MTNDHLARIELRSNSRLTADYRGRRAIQKPSWRAVATWTIPGAVQHRHALPAILAVAGGKTGGVKWCYEGILEEKPSGDGVVVVRFVGPVLAA